MKWLSAADALMWAVLAKISRMRRSAVVVIVVRHKATLVAPQRCGVGFG
jgi:hypothetical protein